VKLLGARHTNVAALGDDNQAIYRWRGRACRTSGLWGRRLARCGELLVIRIAGLIALLERSGW